MGQSNYLIDTNSVIDFFGKKFTHSGMDFMSMVIDEVPKVSVITKIEVLGFNSSDTDQILLTNFMNLAKGQEPTAKGNFSCHKDTKNS
jgi:hypothetical protein